MRRQEPGDVRDRSSMLLHDPYVHDSSPYGRKWYVREPSPTRRDAEVRQSIKDELFWSPYVDESVATLTGTVDSWPERNAAVVNAYEGGAIAVGDELQIKPGRTR